MAPRGVDICHVGRRILFHFPGKQGQLLGSFFAGFVREQRKGGQKCFMSHRIPLRPFNAGGYLKLSLIELFMV